MSRNIFVADGYYHNMNCSTSVGKKLSSTQMYARISDEPAYRQAVHRTAVAVQTCEHLRVKRTMESSSILTILPNKRSA